MGSPARTSWLQIQAVKLRRGFVATWARQHQHCVIVLLICGIAVAATWHRSWLNAQAAHSHTMDRTADVIIADIQSQFKDFERLLHIARALFYASDKVTRSDWKQFATALELDTHATGLHGFGYVARVEPENLNAFIQEARADDMPGFTIQPHPHADRDNTGFPAYIVLYSEPNSRNETAIGIDVASYTRNRQVYHDAARDRKVRVVAGIPLAQSDRTRDGLVAALPVYAQQAGADHVVGWVTAAVVLQDFFEASRSPAWDGNLLTITITNDANTKTVYATAPGEHGTDTAMVRRAMAREREIDMFGQKLRVGMVPASEELITPDQSEAHMVLLVGTLATAFLTLIAWSATRTRQHAIAIARQMTESLRLSEQSQRELAERAELANQAKSEFLANMSHEIRTPMTAILGYADILETDDVDETCRAEAMMAIRRSGRHLLTIINDVLDLSKIESGRLQVVEEVCDIGTLVNDVISGLRQQAECKGLSFQASLESSVPDRVLTDTHRVRQILINLVGNAIKFTERGGIQIMVAHRLGRLQITVRDTGVGIPSDKLDTVFQPFEQADNSLTRRHEGTGLGLTISRRLADLLGGELAACSVVNEGSAFTLDIPASPAQGAMRISQLPDSTPSTPTITALTTQSTLAGARVLLAEDGPDNQKLILFILRKAGITVDLVSNGREAVDRIEAGQEYDLLITDMQMPELDGYAATRLLRSMGYDKPILALTAHAMEGDRERCLEAGCNDYETKPLDRVSLLRTIERLLGGASPDQSARAA